MKFNGNINLFLLGTRTDVPPMAVDNGNFFRLAPYRHTFCFNCKCKSLEFYFCDIDVDRGLPLGIFNVVCCICCMPWGDLWLIYISERMIYSQFIDFTNFTGFVLYLPSTDALLLDRVTSDQRKLTSLLQFIISTSQSCM